MSAKSRRRCLFAALEAENRMLLKQNAVLRQSLNEVKAELRAIRVEQLGHALATD